MAGRITATIFSLLLPTAAIVVATLLTNIATVIAVIGGTAGLISGVFVLVRVHELTELTKPLARKVEKLTTRVDEVESTLRGD